ncbi:MAG: alpha/beta hydrolase [Gemmataceae bacterium]
MRSLALAALLGAGFLHPLQAETAKPRPYTVETIKDVVYYDGDDQHKVKHKLDLYLPKGLKGFPVLFFVHGGAWVHGDKDTFGLYGLFAAAYAKQGIGVVVTNYRLSPAVQHPEHIRDVARAFAWCCKNIERHGGRADQLFLCGHSAGAHLVSLLASDLTYLTAHKLTTSAIRGVIPISGPLVLPPGFMPRVFGSARDASVNASPIKHVHEKMPPFLILYADKDLPGCDRKPSEKFCKAVRDKGNEAEVVEITGSDHIRIMVSAGAAKDRVYETIVEFIRKHATR